MKHLYLKGARSERELLHFLNFKGFSCGRIASSGGTLTPVDIIAMKKGLILGFEIKAHKNKPKLDKNKLQKLREWCERAGAIGFLAWKAPGNRWLFLRAEDAEAERYDDENWIEMESLLDALDII
ncbi:MAG: hypothetical protein DRP27_09700 [Thermotogae bacterium]|nr:MAG: hypothetical protein DRP27_09700 [Thermotogota bacterium]